MEGDLLLAAIAGAAMKKAQNAQPTGIPTSSGITESQLGVISQAIEQGISGIQIPAPQVNVPPAKIEFPSNLQLSFSDTELARIAAAIKPAEAGQPSRLIETRVMTLNFNGSAVVNAQFPTLYRMIAYEFTQDYYLVAATLSCSIVNTSTPVAGFFLARDLGPVVNIDQTSESQTASDVFISQVTHQNSTATTIAPLSRTNTIAFGGDTQFIRVQAGTRIALYACGTSDANNLYTAIANLHITPINP
jgi:hypothetical protein